MRAGVSQPNRPSRRGQAAVEEDDDLREYRLKQERKMLARNTRRETQLASQESRKIERLRKRMDYFEGAHDDEGLKLRDFAKVELAVKGAAKAI